MGLALYYRASNSLVDLQTQPWLLAGDSIESNSGADNEFVFPSVINRRYLQYKAEFETAIQDQSPRLNSVRLYLAPGPTPTPSLTFTPVTGTATNTPTATTTATATATATPSRTATATATTIACSGPPDKVKLLKPKNKANMGKRKVKLKWEKDDCATKFKVIVKMDSKKGKTAFKSSKVKGTKVKTKELARGHKYFWRAKAKNDFGSGSWSRWRKFKVKN
jgi:hypothetical protein